MGNWTIEVEWEPGRWRPVSHLRDVTLNEARRIMNQERGYIEPLRLRGESATTWGQTMAEIRAVEKGRKFEICDAFHPKFEQGCELIAGHRGDHEAIITLNAQWSDET